MFSNSICEMLSNICSICDLHVPFPLKALLYQLAVIMMIIYGFLGKASTFGRWRIGKINVSEANANHPRS